MNNKINILSVNYNSAQDILHCIASVSKSTYQNFQIFIVDNHSTDNSIEAIETGCNKLNLSVHKIFSEDLISEQGGTLLTSRVILIQNTSNKGFAAGNNVAINYLLNERKNEYVWLLNPDVEVEDEVMADLVTLHNNKEKVLTGNLIHYFDEREKVMYYGGFKVHKFVHGIRSITVSEEKNKIDAIAGASLFTDLETFRDLGMLPEEYFLYWEETDFCTTARKKGYVFDVNTRSKIFDRVGSASNTSFTREYLYILSGLRYYRKFYPWHLPMILLSTFAKQIKALFFGSRLKRRAIIFGNIDFLKLLLGIQIDIKRRIKHQ